MRRIVKVAFLPALVFGLTFLGVDPPSWTLPE